MKNNRKTLLVMFVVVPTILLAACGNSSDEPVATLDNQSQNNNSTQNTKGDTANVDSTESASNTDNNKRENIEIENNNDKSNNVPAEKEDPSISINNTEASLKEEYLQKLNDTKEETEELEASDPSTYALKKVENNRWDIWDELLNEIYKVVKEQLPPEEMDQLREEQQNWIKYRDDCALEASLKYKGGTQEHLEYVAVLANLTEERCYELVEEYMN